MKPSPVPAISLPNPSQLKILLRCFTYLRPHWQLTAGAYLMMLLIDGISMLSPQLIRWSIDQGISLGDQKLLTLAVLGLLIFRWYRKRQKAAGLPQYQEPPHVMARKAIMKLESEKYFENGLVKTYYFIFSEILRRYLGAIRNFPAAEYTTEEIVRTIKTEQDRRLIPLLQRSDLVKFADSLPTPARKEEDIKAALEYIRETSPRLEPVKDSSDSGDEVRP